MIRINLLPHREEAKKARREQFMVLAGLVFVLAALVVFAGYTLIGNAISFCEDGDAIRLWARRRENRVLIVVEDTGPGIPDENLETVFRRFYTSRPRGAAFGSNSGLGLSIARQIVEAHGGTVIAENRRDETGEIAGARFVIRLPGA